MRTLLGVMLVMLMGGLELAANADDSFIVIRDGREFLCQPRSPNPGGVKACIDKAYSGPFSRDESMRLCQGAVDTGPAECALEAYHGVFSRDEAIRLCAGSRTGKGPVLCAKKAYQGPFSRDESLLLCSGSGTEAHADCALEAYRGPYSREEAIRLCKASPSAMIRTMKILKGE